MKRYKVMKKVGLMKLTVISFVFILLCSCASDDGCQSAEIMISDLEQLGCNNTAFSMSVLTTNEFELIRNSQDYNRLINLNCRPQINWLEYDMIAGMKGLTSGLSSIDKTLVMNCNNNQLTLTFDITVNLTQIAPQISYHALIPKIKDEQDFFVNINVKQ